MVILQAGHTSGHIRASRAATLMVNVSLLGWADKAQSPRPQDAPLAPSCLVLTDSAAGRYVEEVEVMLNRNNPASAVFLCRI